MREIGSEFWDAPTVPRPRKLFSEDTQWYVSGRSALRAIVEDLTRCGAESVAMPSYCCDSMIRPFLEGGMTISFYDVCPERGVGLCKSRPAQADVLFDLDYFGFSSSDRETYPCIVRDETHSLFCETDYEADYCFGSLRKWCGVLTGGFARAKDGRKLSMGTEPDPAYGDMRLAAMEAKAQYLGTVAAGGEVGEKTYLQTFSQAEELLDTYGIMAADPRDRETVSRLDAAYIRARRRENAAMLMEAFPQWLMFPYMKETDCPLFVPLLLKERDALRRHLIKREIYCPIHWPISPWHRLTPRAELLYRQELSLVCDQRYSREDMERMIAAIRDFQTEE